MSEMLLSILKKKLDSLGSYSDLDAETRRNALKEELQFYVLNFIYHHPEYSKWIMYGGSALRICHGLDRMSVDLDFEVTEVVNRSFLDELKQEIETYFADKYSATEEFLTVKVMGERGLLLRFHVNEELAVGNPSSQVHVKLDLNHFVAAKVATERVPINHDQLSFVIVTYNMSALMASKIAAIFLRGTRGVGKENYEEKGRDIYDLLWYMGKKIVPDLDYLIAKNVDVKDPRALFDRLTLQMNKVNNKNLEQDLFPLFIDRSYIEHWLQSWRESYLRLLKEYQIYTVTKLEKVDIHHDVMSDVFSFVFWYLTEDDPAARVRVIYPMSEFWIRGDDLPGEPNQDVTKLIEIKMNGTTTSPASENKLKLFATLFAKKTEDYLRKSNGVVLGDTIRTKFIRMTAENLNQAEQIVLNRSALLSCTLDDLLK